MEKNRINFQKKIHYLLETIAQHDIETLASLFWIEEKGSLEHRAVHIRNYWLNNKKEDFVPRLFRKEYPKYQFSTLTHNSEALFRDANEFLTIDFELFKERIQEYIQNQSGVNVEYKNQYRYFYVYNKNALEKKNKIDYYTISYKQLLTPNSFAIEVKAPYYKEKEFGINSYHGKLIFLQQKIIILFQNQYDYISAIFNMELINSYTPYIVGVAIGISDLNQKTPVAKKVILSKELLQERDDLYLTLNETETILAQENFFTLQFALEHTKAHLEKVSHKISNINSFLQNASKEFFKDIEYKVAFREFNATSKIIQNVASGMTFYTKSRERVLESVLDSYEYKPFKELYIVMPILNKYNIFAYYSPTTKRIIEKIKELSLKVHIELLCVIEDCKKKMPMEIEDFLEEIKDKVELFVVSSKDIDNAINSYDFIFTNNKDFIFAKLIRSRVPAFRFFKDSTTLDDYESYFYRIKKHAKSFIEFNKNRRLFCKDIEEKAHQKFIGIWHLYTKGEKKFWHDRLEIYENGEVFLYSEGALTDKGRIIHKSKQSLIILEDLVNSNLMTLQFSNNSYHIEKAFVGVMVGKQYMSEDTLFTLFLCSKDEIALDTAKTILEAEDGFYLENGTVKELLKNYLVSKYGYY